MGSWTRKYFEMDILPENAIVIPGTTKNEQKQKYLYLFDEVISCGTGFFEWYIVKRDGIEYLIILHIYGAPMIIDLIHILKEGLVQKVIFLGAVHGLETNMNVGDIILPRNVQALEGILSAYENTSYTQPNESFFRVLTNIFVKDNIKYFDGKTVSVPSVFTKVDRNLFDNDVIGLEMECSAFLHFTKENGIKGAAILVISDTKDCKLTDSQNNRYITMMKIMGVIIGKHAMIAE